MPKTNVDYSDTIIYKICCKDESIKDIYVGHTTNFIQRKYFHKIACKNLNNTIKIYNVIRSNGGWDNWNMVEIAKYNCKNATEARIKEQYHYDELKASLNSCPPYVDIKKYFCDICNLQCINKTHYEQHIICNLHLKKKDILPTNNSLNLFVCNFCHYTTLYSKDYKKHLRTKKHIVFSTETSGNIEEIQKVLKCEDCSKEFKTNAGLWKHKNKGYLCTKCDNSIDNKEDISDKQLLMMLLKQQTELIKGNTELRKEQLEIKELLLEVINISKVTTIKEK
jgi:hypothetical protein